MLFSVIIPTYNRAHLLPGALDSLLHQNHLQWEAVVVDDQSTDATASTALQYAQKDSRIKYVQTPKRSERNAARLLGLQHASGQFIIFLDDDDYFLPSHLKQLAQSIARHGSAALYKTGMEVRYNNGTVQAKSQPYDANAEHPVQYLWRERTNLLSFAFPAGILQDVPLDARFYLGEDMHLLLRVALRLPIIQLPGYTAVSVAHGANSSSLQCSPADVQNALDCMADFWATHRLELLPLLPHSAYKRWRWGQLLHFARAAARQRHFAWSWRYLWQARYAVPHGLGREWLKSFMVFLKCSLANSKTVINRKTAKQGM